MMLSIKSVRNSQFSIQLTLWYRLFNSTSSSQTTFINFYHNHSAALNRQEMRARKVRNSITSQRRDEVIMEEDDFKLVANHVSEVLDATRAKVSLRKIEARKKQKKQKKSNSKRKQ